MSYKGNRVYVLVEIQPGKEREFADDVLSKGLLIDSKVERIDFVHGSFDFVLMLTGTMQNVDRRIMELRKSPFVRKTETLICFEILSWEDLSGRLNEDP
jgi:hypothetical protein